MTVVKRVNHPLFSMFDDFFRNDIERFKGFDGTKGQVPAVNVSENETAFSLEVVAPGFAKGDFKLHVDEDMLTISSEAEEKHEEKEGERMIRKEYRRSAFSRSFTLPEIVDAEKISATYQDGLLQVSLPKKEVVEKQSKREIAVG